MSDENILPLEHFPLLPESVLRRPRGDLVSLCPPHWPGFPGWRCIHHCFQSLQHRTRLSIKNTEGRKEAAHHIKSVSWSKPSQGFLWHLEWNLARSQWVQGPGRCCSAGQCVLSSHSAHMRPPGSFFAILLYSMAILTSLGPQHQFFFLGKKINTPFLLGLSWKLTFPDPLLHVTLVWLLRALMTDIFVFLFTYSFVYLSPAFTTTWKSSL